MICKWISTHLLLPTQVSVAKYLFLKNMGIMPSLLELPRMLVANNMYVPIPDSGWVWLTFHQDPFPFWALDSISPGRSMEVWNQFSRMGGEWK